MRALLVPGRRFPNELRDYLCDARARESLAELVLDQVSLEKKLGAPAVLSNSLRRDRTAASRVRMPWV